MHGYEVDLNEGSTQDFYVTFFGPKETIYEGAVYRVHVELPDQYPFASPSIGFEPHTIFHPNVDERSGSVCLDVINQTWTPMYSLTNVFEVFLPQLLTYPNPADPLNSDAASMFMKDPNKYEEKVRSFVALSANKYAERQKQKEEDAIANSGASVSTANPHDVGDMTIEDDGGEFELHDDDLDLEFEADD
jgi:ubiquitin-conjugating enzyme E2 H